MTELATVAALYTYPVKGMTAHALQRAALEPGATMPLDRVFAIENGPGRFDPTMPRHLPKINFLMLMRNERLAGLEARFEQDTGCLTILREGRQVARGDLSSALGRGLIEQFLAAYFATELRGAPKIVSAQGHSFSDVAKKCLHIVNLASVRELERIAARAIDPLRFRANVYLDGLSPFAEIHWIGRRLRLGGVELTVIDRTVRCAATEVDPQTAKRDLSIPALLRRTFNRDDFGIYMEVTKAGMVAVGDPAAVDDNTAHDAGA